MESLINSLKLQSTRNEKTQWIHCPCKACKNFRVFSDPTTIRSHVIVSGFVKDYMIWKKLGVTDAPPPANNPPDEMILDEKFDRMLDAYIDVDSMVMMLTTGPSMVRAVMRKLTMVIF